MSGYKGHLMFGFAITSLIVITNYLWGYLPFSINLIYLMPITAIYSLLPDVDIGTSKIFIFIDTLFLFGIIYCLITNSIMYGIILCLALIMILYLKHRGMAHSIIIGFLFSLPLLSLGLVYVLFGFINYLSHLVLDREVKLI